MLTIRSVQVAALLAIAIAAAAIAQTSVPEARAGGGCRGTPITEVQGSAQASPNTVLMLDICFEPSILRVEPGAEVTWTNTSKVERHNVAGQNVSWGSYDEVRDGQSLSHTFEKAGTYAYYCFVHNGMIGVVVVGDGKGAGSVARADAGGREVLASIPETSEEPERVAPSSSATAESGSETDWPVLAGMAVLGLVAAGGVVVLARRR